MGKKVTLQDIADHCGLSKSMVAYVIREPDTCKATEKTKALVAQAVRELDYIPNFAAKALSTRKSYTIGILLPSLINFYQELQLAIDSELAQNGYFGISSHWEGYLPNSAEEFRKAFERIKSHGVDGIITCHYDESIADSGTPIVTYGNERIMMDCVYPDKLTYAKEVVAYLHRNGHRKIGYMGFHSDIRKEAICVEMRNAGLEVCDAWFINAMGLMENGYSAMRSILKMKKRPTAVIVHSDEMAMGAIRAAGEMRVKIPDDISLISYDNLRESAYLIPALTTFDQHYKLAAEYLVGILIARIRNPLLPMQKRSFKLSLVERESVRNLNPNRKRGVYK